MQCAEIFFLPADICQLGLARIRYECDADLSYTVNKSIKSLLYIDLPASKTKSLSVLNVHAKIKLIN